MRKYRQVIAYLSLVALLIANATYEGYARSRFEHRWCNLLVTLDTPSIPPQSNNPRAVVIQREIHDLRHQNGC